MAGLFSKELFGLYRDDGMAAVRGGAQEVERWSKKLFSLFSDLGLKITVEGGKKTVDFLDVVFNLEDASHCPFVKPNTTTNYVSVESNHPKTILKTLPRSVSKRLSTNSSSKEQFEHHTGHFKEAMRRAGHSEELDYIEEDEPSKTKRKRNVMYFNPPWSANISTNIVGKFLTLVRKHFSVGSPLYHLFNPKKLKASYSTVPNMKRLISGHNKRVIRKAEGRDDPPSYGCNCDDGVNNCPLGGECKTPSLVYKADIDMGEGNKVYIGQTANTFKARYQLHNSDTNCGRKRTGLTKYILEQEKKGRVCQELKWSKISDAKPRSKGDKICSLCNTEKTLIAIADKSSSLNKRSEILQRCRHRDKLVLSNSLRSATKRRPRTVGVGLEDIREETREEGEEERDEETGMTEEDQGGGNSTEEEAEDEEESEEFRRGPVLRSRSKVDYKKFF